MVDISISTQDLMSLSCAACFYAIARAVIREEAWTWAIVGFCVCLQGWEFSWSCGVDLGGFPAIQELPALSYSKRAPASVHRLTRPDFFHALICSTFDGGCMAFLAAAAVWFGGNLSRIELRTSGVLLLLGWVQNALVTRFTNLDLNTLATAPLAPLPKCTASGPDARDVCWSNQSMWVAAPLITYALAVSEPASHPARIGASVLLLLALPLASCAQGPGTVLSANPAEFGSLAAVLVLAGAAYQRHPVISRNDSVEVVGVAAGIAGTAKEARRHGESET
jgi:hypothetical protein